MRFLEPLDDVFSGRSSIRVLRALVGLPADFGVSAREIGRRAQVSHPTATKVLGTLVREGLVDMKRSPAGDEYSLRYEQILARELIRVFGIERGLLDNLRDFLGQAISRHAPGVVKAFLFGSVLSAGMEPDSDIDIAVAWPLGSDAYGPVAVSTGMAKVADEVRARFGNHLHVVLGDGISDVVGTPEGKSLWARVRKEGIEVPIVTQKQRVKRA